MLVGDGVRGPAGMVHIPGGEFLMGSDSKMAQANEKPAHKVRIHGLPTSTRQSETGVTA